MGQIQAAVDTIFVLAGRPLANGAATVFYAYSEAKRPVIPIHSGH